MKNDVLKSFAQKAKRRLVGGGTSPSAKVRVISNEDVQFRSKVEFLLSQEDVITNPVHYLLDDKIFQSLNEEARERYLLTTLDKYNALKNQIESSKSDFAAIE